MTLSAYPALKLIPVAATVIAAAVVASDPTVKVALIAGSAVVLASLPTFILGMLTRRDNRRDAKEMKQNQEEMKVSMDGHFGKLLAERKQAEDDLAVKSVDLARAEGRREGVESKEDVK